MLPKSYLVFKWLVYASATLLFFALQSLVLNHIRVLGLTPFLYPLLPAIVAMYEGRRRGPVFALALGVVCDAMLHGPLQGFFTILFPAVALFAAVMGENFLSPGFSAVCLCPRRRCSPRAACVFLYRFSPAAAIWP